MNRFQPHRDKPVNTVYAAGPARAARPGKLACGPVTLRLGRPPLVMGILNVTPDSFSDGGRYFDAGTAVRHALVMRAAGADILDVGGESTRPGARPVSAGEELDRVLPVIEALTQSPEFVEAPLPISIDTRKAEVADVALR
ncbi:MAG: dihydropteroate synthase, partial [Candidatus Latescibacterota bacterium]